MQFNSPSFIATGSFHKILLLVSLILITLPSLAQQGTPQRGTYSQGSYALSDIENINATNGNLMFHLPLGSLPAGRKGMGAGVGLYYNSKLWDSWLGYACDYNGNCESDVEQLYASPEGGWRFGYEYKLQTYSRPQFYDCSDPRSMYVTKLVMSFPDGSIHEFRPYGYDDYFGDGWYAVGPNGRGNGPNCTSVTYTTSTMTYYSTDSTHLRLDIQHDWSGGWLSNIWTLYLPDGGHITNSEAGANGQRIYDSNNNFVEIQSVILPNGNPAHKVVDQFNRSLVIEYASTATYVRVPSANGQTLTWTITWKDINYSTNTGYYSVGGGGGWFDFGLPWISGVDQIITPAQASGYAYTFNYNIAPGLVEGFGEIKSVSLPSADQNKAQATYTYYPYGYASVYDVQHNPISQKSLKYLNQHDNPTSFDNPANYITEIWSYNIPTTEYGGSSTITSPDGSIVTESFYPPSGPNPWQGGLIYKSERPDGTVVERLSQPNTPQSPYLVVDINPYTKTEFVSIKNAAGTLVKTAITDYNYDKNGNLMQRAEYDFVDYASVPRDGTGKPTGIPAGAVPQKVIVNTFNSPTPDASDKTTVTANAYNKPGSPNVRIAVASTEVRSGTGTTVARTEITYDNALTTGNQIQVKSWDSVKGGLTAPLNAGNSSSVATQYDAYGNISLVTDARNIQTKFDYDPVIAGDSSTANLYVTKIRKAYGTSVQLSSSFTYDFASGLTVTATDDDNQVTNKTTYDDLGRPTMVQEAFGTASERRVVSQYYDAIRAVVTKTDLDTVGDGKIVAIQHSDQLGRNRLSRSLENPATQSATLMKRSTE